jgi:hypothetical protein
MGTVAQNALTHGTGALNIDGCRITTSDNLNGGAYAQKGSERNDGWRMKRDQLAGTFNQPTGRWPANLIFSHQPTCVAVGQKKVKGGNDPRAANGTVYNAQNKIYGKINTKYSSNSGYADADGKETITAYKCHNNCPVERLDSQDAGGASRFFQHVKVIPD